MKAFGDFLARLQNGRINWIAAAIVAGGLVVVTIIKLAMRAAAT